jgi:hypothetical protein
MDLDLQKLLATLVLSTVGHTEGHFQEASNRGIPMSLHGGREEWKSDTHPDTMPDNKWGIPYKDPDNYNRTAISGAGFETQEKIKGALNTPEASMATGIYKLLYPLIANKMPGMSAGATDIAGMEKGSGNKNVTELAILSGLWDLVKGGTDFGQKNLQNSDLSFSTFGTGTPGLKFTKRF